MTFIELNGEFVQLRRTLRTFLGDDALDDISLQSPMGNDEASFLRLIAWSYVLVFEAGRITIPYLTKLPSRVNRSQAELKATCTLIHDLRTWSFHNLSFNDKRGLGVSKRTTMWFIGNSGTLPPSDVSGWQKCYESLCGEVILLVAHCKSAVEVVLADAEARDRTIADLSRRLARNWPAHKYDQLLSEVLARIGQRLDIPRFRQARFEKWRAYLETIPEGDDPLTLVVRMIERDVLDHFGSVLPIDSDDIVSNLGLGPGHEVGEALYAARRIYDSGVTDRMQLLESLREYYLEGGLQTLSSDTTDPTQSS